jgi:dephospho-CoA kinase
LTLSIGLTGCIGSGKSLVCSVFEHLGVGVFISDTKAKELYKDKDFLKEIAQVFGQKIVKDNVLQAQLFADIVFSDKEKLSKLNSIIHPRVFAMYDKWKSKQNSPYVIAESAIMFESGWSKSFDKIICIDTPMDIAIQRVMKRDKVSQEQVTKRMENQMPLQQKLSLADYTLINDNQTMLLPQILELHKKLLSI